MRRPASAAYGLVGAETLGPDLPGFLVPVFCRRGDGPATYVQSISNGMIAEFEPAPPEACFVPVEFKGSFQTGTPAGIVFRLPNGELVVGRLPSVARVLEQRFEELGNHHQLLGEVQRFLAWANDISEDHLAGTRLPRLRVRPGLSIPVARARVKRGAMSRILLDQLVREVSRGLRFEGRGRLDDDTVTVAFAVDDVEALSQAVDGVELCLVVGATGRTKLYIRYRDSPSRRDRDMVVVRGPGLDPCAKVAGVLADLLHAFSQNDGAMLRVIGSETVPMSLKMTVEEFRKLLMGEAKGEVSPRSRGGSKPSRLGAEED